MSTKKWATQCNGLHQAILSTINAKSLENYMTLWSMVSAIISEFKEESDGMEDGDESMVMDQQAVDITSEDSDGNESDDDDDDSDDEDWEGPRRCI